MKKQHLLAALAVAAMAQSALAGGYLTNTNHSVAFLREPSRDASIGIDGAYSNPAGLLYLPQGLQIQFNAQNVAQHRYVESTFAPFAYGAMNNRETTKKYEGEAKVPILPSLHVSYNMNEKWNINGSFMVVGGGGKCTFDEGLGSFEAAASMLPVLGGQAGLDIMGYNMKSFMRGKQYYFGFQVGAGYKVNEHLAVSLQGRLVYGLANYYGYIKDISVVTPEAPNGMLAKDYFMGLYNQCIEGAGKLKAGAQQCLGAAEQYSAAGMAEMAAQYTAMAQEYQAQAAGLEAKAPLLAGYAQRTEDVTLNCDEKGLGFTPIVGIDWRPNEHWNLAAKYEFKTRIRLENESANSASADKLDQLAQFRDGGVVKEDIPAYLALGVMYSPVSAVCINAGWHCFYDKQATKEGNTQDLLRHNTHEWNAGFEWDATKRLTISGGWQNTCYGNSDAMMKDISFTTSSNTFGFGTGIKISEHFDLDIAYFFTKYSKYTKNYDVQKGGYNGTTVPGTDIFWRDNKVLGLGVTYKL